MRASRLLSILTLLQVRGRVSARALAAELEVSVRTIHRDIDQLSAAGVPVYAERGRDGGFALLDGFRTKLTGLTRAEAEALTLAGIGAAAADLGVGAEAAAAQLKMLASLPPDSSASAGRIAARFHLDPANWYARPEAPAILPALASAVWREQRVRVRYESWKATVTRDLDPLGLVLKAGVWYLVAAVKAEPRSYRASNILSLEVLDAPARRPPRFDLARFWAAWVRDFETRLMSDRATLKLSPVGLRLLRDTSPIAGEAANATAQPCLPRGWTKATVPVEALPQAARQMLRLGAEAVVLSPPALREAIAQEARRVAHHYEAGRRRQKRR